MPIMARAICILGMHRSGTSLAARLVQSLGVYLGAPEEFLAPNFANPEGYSELEAIVQAHDAIFEELSRSWDTMDPLPEGWHREPRIRPHRDRLEEIVRRTFAGRDTFGWKDPRTCLTLPLWKEIMDSQGISVQYLIVFRNPLDAAKSLATRERFEVRDALGLWLHYNLQILTETRGQTRAAIRYEDLLDDSSQAVSGLSEALSLEKPDEQEELAIINATLCHHRSTDAELSEVAPELVIFLHERIQQALNGEITWSEADHAAEELFREFRRFSSVFPHDGRRPVNRPRGVEEDARFLADPVEGLNGRLEHWRVEYERERKKTMTLEGRLSKTLEKVARLEGDLVAQHHLVKELREHLDHAVESRRLLATDLAEIYGSRWWMVADWYWRFRRWIGLPS